MNDEDPREACLHALAESHVATSLREERLRALAESLVLELDGAHEPDPLETVAFLSSEACRDLKNALHGMEDLGEALREALQIAAARGRGELSPDQDTRLAELEQILVGWNGGRDD